MLSIHSPVVLSGHGRSSLVLGVVVAFTVIPMVVYGAIAVVQAVAGTVVAVARPRQTMRARVAASLLQPSVCRPLCLIRRGLQEGGRNEADKRGDSGRPDDTVEEALDRRADAE